jgi:chromate transporter
MLQPEPSPSAPPFRTALRFWWRLGWISFGGPTGQIAIMHEEIVDRKKWIDEASFLHALNFCMMLPGPEAQQLATFLGWRLHGTRGALCAGLLFILPAVFILWALSLVYVLYGSVPSIAAAFYGLVPAVLAIVLRALFRLASRTLNRPLLGFIALAAIVLIGLSRQSYPAVVLGAGVLGWISHRSTDLLPAPAGNPAPIRLMPLLRMGAVCLLAWWTPLLLSFCLLGPASTITREGFFFSKATLLGFGGAYALLPYVAQHAVDQLHWLDARDMMHGLALAETTPGPLIMVLQFVGFLGAWHQPGVFSPVAAATLGSLMTTWVTFIPSFLFILVGAPFVQRLSQVRALQSALRAISAAVVGVMANFALWFGAHAVFPNHRFTQPDLFVVVLAVAALFVLYRTHISVVVLLAGCAGVSVLTHALF